MTTSAPYGPSTSAIRRFLVQLAALDDASRAIVVTRFESIARTRAFVVADAMLGETIERSGRLAERDALAGPLLRLVARDSAMLPQDGAEQPADLDPIAEPALAALLALLAADVLSPRHFDSLYSPFEPVIPRASLEA